MLVKGDLNMKYTVYVHAVHLKYTQGYENLFSKFVVFQLSQHSLQGPQVL